MNENPSTTSTNAESGDESPGEIRAWFKLIDRVPENESSTENLSEESRSVLTSSSPVETKSNGEEDEQEEEKTHQTFDLNVLMSIFQKFQIEQKPKIEICQNPLEKIFRSGFKKNSATEKKIRWNSDDEKKVQRKTTSEISFRTDWAINRRPTRRKNIFYLLQNEPRRKLSFSERNESEHFATNQIDPEKIKEILFRTYCPRIAHAVRVEHFFAAKPSFAFSKQNKSKHDAIVQCQIDDSPTPKIVENQIFEQNDSPKKNGKRKTTQSSFPQPENDSKSILNKKRKSEDFLPVDEASDKRSSRQKKIRRSSTVDETDKIRKNLIFLQRNRRRVKEKRSSTFESVCRNFSLNFYHRETEKQEKKEEKIEHRDLFNVFLNFLRRSHFAKLGRFNFDLVDRSSFYAHLAQLNLVLNEIFESILHFKSASSDVFPSNALKNCPDREEFQVYYELIAEPIDLRIIRTKLDRGEYLSSDSFEKDFLLLFNNAITYCGEDSEIGTVVNELKNFYLDLIEKKYRPVFELLKTFPEKKNDELSWENFRRFVNDFHEKEIFDGDIRQTVYRVVFEVERQSPPLTAAQLQRMSKLMKIIHCRCASNNDEIDLVQCYSCHLWQHLNCVKLKDFTKVYFCFECDPQCQIDRSLCLKRKVEIKVEDSKSLYSSFTRDDGFLIRTNESYRVVGSNEIVQLEEIFRESEKNVQVRGIVFRRARDLFGDVDRKFYPNEVIRCDSLKKTFELKEIRSFCLIVDFSTFAKGRPIVDSMKSLTFDDIFICEFRLDKNGKNLIRLTKSKNGSMNTKFYAFENYLEKLTLKRQSIEFEVRRKPKKFSERKFQEKKFRIERLVENLRSSRTGNDESTDRCVC